MMDPRVASAESLLTGPRLLAGHGQGLTRPPFIARLLGVPLADRAALLAWIEAHELWHEAPWHALHERPEAGTVDLAVLRAALLKVAGKGRRLPFRCDHLPELSHAA